MSDDTSRETARPYHWIGKNVTKPDALEKALGATEYVGDMVLPGMLHAKIRWAGTAHAVIRSIDTRDAARVPGVAAVLTAADVPGTNRYGLAVLDQRALADDKVRSAGDALALVAAEDEEAAEEAGVEDQGGSRTVAAHPHLRGRLGPRGALGPRGRQRVPAHDGAQG